ncbi:MAG: hypothetical protein ACRDEA_07155 [Microcystaceae cyanobacterium]
MLRLAAGLEKPTLGEVL